MRKISDSEAIDKEFSANKEFIKEQAEKFKISTGKFEDRKPVDMNDLKIEMIKDGFPTEPVKKSNK